MRNHPTLNEVLKDQPDHEWLNITVSGFSISDFPNCENPLGEISNPNFSLLLGPSESEFGTIAFNRGVASVNRASNESLQNLEGDKPLGSINYYDPEYTGLTVNVNESLYDNLLSLLSDLRCLSLRVSIPSLDDKDVKCLPILSYQLVYKQDSSEKI